MDTALLAQTPKAGHRKGTVSMQSLAGFDPFSPVETTPVRSSKTFDVTAFLKNIPPRTSQDESSRGEGTPPVRRDSNNNNKSSDTTTMDQQQQQQQQQQLRSELLKIASHLGKQSPRTTATATSASSTPLTTPRRISSRSRSNATTPNRKNNHNSSSSSNSNSPPRNPFTSFARKKGRAHRKSLSLQANTQLWKEVQEDLEKPKSIRSLSTNHNSSSSSNNNSPSALPPAPPLTTAAAQGPDATLLQDLWMSMSQEQQQDENDERNRLSHTTGPESLYIPNLAKPRPTSLLPNDNAVVGSSWEFDPSEWQMELPSKADFLLTARLCQFLDTYRQQECLLDLATLKGIDRMQLSEFAAGGTLNTPNPAAIADLHRPVVESFLDCGSDVIVQVHGYFHSDAADPDERREVLMLECQRQFVVVFRGTTAEQKASKQPAQKTVDLANGHKATVFAAPLNALMQQQLEARTFDLLDQLTAECPFCDVYFCGHAFGASMATLAAYLYAQTRADQRVAALLTACPKVGTNSSFRWAVHALPNLKVMRLEQYHYHDRSTTTTTTTASAGGSNNNNNNNNNNNAEHVGHLLRLGRRQPPAKAASSQQLQQQIEAFPFHHGRDDAMLAPRRASLLFKREQAPAIREYVQELESLTQWVRGYHDQDGAGVRGKDNEAREVV